MLFPFHPYAFHGFLAVTTGGSGIVILGLFAIIYWYIHQKNKLTHETIRKMIDSGQPITPETVAALKGATGFGSNFGTNFGTNFTKYTTPENLGSARARRDLRNGILLTCIGAGLVMFIHGPGWIVLAVGVAHLVLAHLDRSKDPDDTGTFKTAWKGVVQGVAPATPPTPAQSATPTPAPAPYVQSTPYVQPAPTPATMTPAPAPVIIPPPPQSFTPPAESYAPPIPPPATPDQPLQPPFTPQA